MQPYGMVGGEPRETSKLVSFGLRITHTPVKKKTLLSSCFFGGQTGEGKDKEWPTRWSKNVAMPARIVNNKVA